MLQRLVTCVAETGRLCTSVADAARLVHAGGSGVTRALIATAPEQRDPRLPEAMREAILAAITTASSTMTARGAQRLAARAVALKAALGDASNESLSAGERQLLEELLDRLAGSR